MANPNTETHHNNHTSPKMYIIGYLLSIVLTVGALWLTLSHGMTLGPLVFTIIALAGLQIVVQLFFFMHVTEGEGPHYHLMALIIGLIFTAVIIGGSIWIMEFNSQVQ